MILLLISFLAVAKIYHFRKHLEFWLHSEISSNSGSYVLNNIDINCSVESYKKEISSKLNALVEAAQVK